jgi:predicted Zn-dependent protease
VPDLGDLCRVAVDAAEPGEAVEAYAEESRRTEAKALRGEVEGLQFSESRGGPGRPRRSIRVRVGGRPGRRRGS